MSVVAVRADALALPQVSDANNPVRDFHERVEASKVTEFARCPICHAPLVARVTCRGPGFTCLCHESANH